MKSAKTPEAPDPKVTAAAQTGTNIGTAIAQSRLNNVNQITPDGSLTYRQVNTTKYTDPTTGEIYDIPQFTATQKLSPQQQAIKGQSDAAELNLAGLANDQSGFLKGYMARPFSLGGLPSGGNVGAVNRGTKGIATTYGDEGDYADQRGRVEEALMSRMNPQLERDREALRTQLTNQGLRIGSEAYNDAMRTFGEQSNDARMQAILGAGEEQTRLAGLDHARAAFGNQAQSQGFGQQQALFDAMERLRARSANEALTERNQPINEITALLSGSQVAQPSFVNTGSTPIPTTDYAGLVQNNYAQQVAQANAKAGRQNATMGGLFQLGGTLGGAAILSDRRAKTDIEKVGKVRGQNVYAYRYKAGGPMQLGLMADEVERKRPEAVVTTPSGLKAVDYGKAMALGA